MGDSMRTIIAGSRGINDINEVRTAVNASGFKIKEVVSGRARGVDRLGERWADEHGIPKKYFPADWEQYGLRAGHFRNEEMAEYAEALIAIWDGLSSGSRDMIELGHKYNLELFVHIVKPSKSIDDAFNI